MPNNESDRRAENDQPPMAGDIPNEAAAVAAFPAGEDVPLKEQADLIDEDGTDIRQYTGEPVETDEGVVIPQQMAVGAQNVVGGGEFPRGEPPRGTDDDADETASGEAASGENG